LEELKTSLADGTPIVVRAIVPVELGRVVLRCWPERETLDRLFEEQGTIGMAAWDGDACVAQLHCYRVTAPHGTEWRPEWGANWWTDSDRIFAGWDQWGPCKAELGLRGPVWCHACFHVGRTLDDPERNDARYLGQGIGTALCRASVSWACGNGYRAVLAPGAADGLVEFARWYGHLPWTTYARLGFRSYAVPREETDVVPGWAKGEVHEPVASEIRNALRTRPVHEILERLMVLDLSSANAGDVGDQQ
jgi:hypothetical protein